MATPEGKVKDKIKALLKKHGAYYTMPVMTGMATNGTPDFSVCHAGRYAGVEAKAGAGKPTKLQWVRLAEIEAAGGSTMVINETNIEVLEQWLRSASATTRAIRSSTSDAVKEHVLSL